MVEEKKKKKCNAMEEITARYWLYNIMVFNECCVEIKGAFIYIHIHIQICTNEKEEEKTAKSHPKRDKVALFLFSSSSKNTQVSKCICLCFGVKKRVKKEEGTFYEGEERKVERQENGFSGKGCKEEIEWTAGSL